MRSQGKVVRAFEASRLNRLLGLEPPERAMVNRPRFDTASFVARITNSAAASNNSCGVVSVRISTEELIGLHSLVQAGDAYYLLLLFTPDGCATRCSQQPGFLIGHNVNRDGLHQRTQASLVHKCFHENGAGQFAENLGGDAAGKK